MITFVYSSYFCWKERNLDNRSWLNEVFFAQTVVASWLTYIQKWSKQPPMLFKSCSHAFWNQTAHLLCKWGKFWIHDSMFLGRKSFRSWKADNLRIYVDIWQTLTQLVDYVCHDRISLWGWYGVPLIANGQSTVWWEFHLLFSREFPRFMQKLNKLTNEETNYIKRFY